jgi:GNAT superfamily N-acetyltransferase
MSEVDTPECISVSVQIGYLCAATAGIDLLPAGHWWVSRVFVKPEHRRKGFGSQCLKRAIELIRKRSSAPILVAPGGYDMPFEEQQAFYARHGFVGRREMWRRD